MAYSNLRKVVYQCIHEILFAESSSLETGGCKKENC